MALSSKSKLLLGIVIAALVVIGGCQMLARKAGEMVTEKMIEKATGDKANVDIKDGKMTVTTSEGTMTTGGGLPEGWPTDVPVYEGANIQFSGAANPADSQEGGMALIFSTQDDPATVTEFYKQKLGAAGWAVMNTMQAQGNTVLILQKNGQTMSVSVGGANGMTAVTIGIQNGQ